MSTKLLTNDYKLHIARQLEESLNESSNTSYYLFLGSHIPRTNQEVPEIENTEKITLIDVYRNMIAGKRISSQDISLVIRNIPYVSNTVYEMFDDKLIDIFNKDFYVSVSEGSFLHTYKCLDNNSKSRSISIPQFSHITGSNTSIYQTADGYRWKYMYSVSNSIIDKFGTSDFIPVVSNTTVQSQAIDGAIDIIKVDDGGRGYDNYLSGVFSSSDLRIAGDPSLFALANNIAPSINGFYTDCLLYLSAGNGAGAYRKIIDYFVSANGALKIIRLESPLTNLDLPTNGTEYQITPRVEIIGDGNQTINAVARALVNSISSNSIYTVEMLERGSNYSYFSASVTANSVVQVDKEAVVRPIYSPPGGHGSDSAAELGAKTLCVSVKLSNNESNTILTDNQFQQIGILKDPLFNDVKLNFESANGVFGINELVYKINPIRINKDATINTTSNSISCNSAEFQTQVKVNDILYLKSSNGSSHQLTTVSGITNSSFITVNSNGFFSCTETQVYLANVSSTGYVKVSDSSYIILSNTDGVFSANDKIIGLITGSFANLNSISRSNVIKGFDTFIQLYKYEVNLTSGIFQENENVFIGSNVENQIANASIHSIINNGGNDRTIYTSNQVGIFATGENITGANSNAIASINIAYDPEILFGSGDILYLENIESVSRSNSQSETFKIILEY
jgi:hypothetical protein